MKASGFIALVFIMLVFFVLNTRAHSHIVTSIKDNGCSSHPHEVIEQKDRIDTYNMKGFE